MGSAACVLRNIRLPSCLLEVAVEARTEAESTLYRHPHESSSTSLSFKMEVSSVKTCGFIASTPLMIYLSLSISAPSARAPSAWGYYFVNFQGAHICRSARQRGRISTNYTYLKLAEPLSPSKYGQILWLLPGT